MRMWMVDVKYLCNYHLVKEHNDIHQFLHYIEKGNFDMIGYNFPIVKLEPEAIEDRHRTIKKEMEYRGIKHIGGIGLVNLRPYLSYQLKIKADLWFNIKELCRTCKSCRRRIL